MTESVSSVLTTDKTFAFAFWTFKGTSSFVMDGDEANDVQTSVSLLRLETGHLLLFHTGMKVPLMQAPADIFYKWLKLKQKNNNS